MPCEVRSLCRLCGAVLVTLAVGVEGRALAEDAPAVPGFPEINALNTFHHIGNVADSAQRNSSVTVRAFIDSVTRHANSTHGVVVRFDRDQNVFALVHEKEFLAGHQRQEDSEARIPNSAATPGVHSDKHPTGRDLSAVVGADNRVRTPNEWPYIAVGKIVATDRAAAEGTCTGWLMSGRHIVTAAHCVVDDFGVFKEDWRFYPGLQGGNATYGSAGWVAVDFHPSYVTLQGDGRDEYSWFWDFAVITLDTSFEDTVGHLGWQTFVLPDSCPQPTWCFDDGTQSTALCFSNYLELNGIEIVGYGNIQEDDNSLWQNTSGECELMVGLDCSRSLAFHQCDTYFGTSGGPALDAAGYAYGVLVGSQFMGDGNRWNVAVPVDSEKSSILACYRQGTECIFSNHEI